jgi:hypothetical protein
MRPLHPAVSMAVLAVLDCGGAPPFSTRVRRKAMPESRNC